LYWDRVLYTIKKEAISMSLGSELKEKQYNDSSKFVLYGYLTMSRKLKRQKHWN